MRNAGITPLADDVLKIETALEIVALRGQSDESLAVLKAQIKPKTVHLELPGHGYKPFICVIASLFTGNDHPDRLGLLTSGIAAGGDLWRQSQQCVHDESCAAWYIAKYWRANDEYRAILETLLLQDDDRVINANGDSIMSLLVRFGFNIAGFSLGQRTDVKHANLMAIAGQAFCRGLKSGDNKTGEAMMDQLRWAVASSRHLGENSDRLWRETLDKTIDEIESYYCLLRLSGRGDSKQSAGNRRL